MKASENVRYAQIRAASADDRPEVIHIDEKSSRTSAFHFPIAPG